MSGVKRVVGLSGGIDSQAAALWVRRRFPAEEVLLLNADAGGNEHPITSSFLRWYSDTIFPVVTVQALIKDLGNRGIKPGATRDRRTEFAEDDLLTFERLAYIKGRFPSRKAQFCTEHLKLAPQRRWCEENLVAKGIDFERYVGVRREEGQGTDSPTDRSNIPDRRWDEYFDCEIIYPLASWTKEECFDYVREAGEEVNPLYLMGFGRVGCAPCVNSGKEDVRNWAAHAPEMIEKIRRWEAYVGYTFFPPCIPRPEWTRAMRKWRDEWTVEEGSPEYLRLSAQAADLVGYEPEEEGIAEGSDGGCTPTLVRARMKGMKGRFIKPGAPPAPKRPINWIDEVVTWSRTAHGGNQFELPMLEAAAAAKVCSSRYGLCE